MEKVFLSYPLSLDNYGDLEFEAISGYIPIKYQALSLSYKKELRKYMKLLISSKYRNTETSDTFYNSGFVDKRIGLQFGNEYLGTSLFVSQNSEYFAESVNGYKFDLHFGMNNFIFEFAWSKNHSEDLAKLPLQDETLFTTKLIITSFNK